MPDGARATSASTAGGYCFWSSQKPYEDDVILVQVKAWAGMAFLPSHVAVRRVPGSNGQVGWGAFIERDVQCHHCGAFPDTDGDHSCPCPRRDKECYEHLIV